MGVEPTNPGRIAIYKIAGLDRCPTPPTELKGVLVMATFQKFRVLHYFFTVNARNKTIAHCLDFDLATSGDSMEDAERRLDVLVKFQIESFLKSNGHTRLGGQAPKRFWSSYTNALRHGGALPSSTLRIDVPQPVPMAVPYGELEIVSAQLAA